MPMTRDSTTRKAPRTALAAVAVLLAVFGVSACGGAQGDVSGARPDLTREVVAKVGSTAVRKSELNHWMSTLAGGDFYDIARRHAVPVRLASEPPDYAACVASLKSAAAKTSARTAQTTTVLPASAAQLLEKCHELYVALRSQATAYVIEGDWLIALAATLGLKTSDSEIRSELKRIKALEYPRPGQFERFLANSRRSLADELFVIRLDLLERKLGKLLSTHDKQIKLLEAGHRVTAETNCRAGYVVEHCRQFTKSKPPRRSAVVLLEQVATITGIECINRAACG
jgi:hypothetical protein